MKNTTNSAGYGISLTVIVAGVLIAGAIFWSARVPSTATSATAQQAAENFRLPNESDHVRGNQDGTVTVIEFGDFECPFCARLHPTLKRIVEEQPNLTWIYRHFPLSSIHSRALGATVASECIAKLGGNEAFWTFADSVFADQRQLNSSFYEEFAASAGVDASAFKACLSDRSIASKVSADGNEAVQAGGRGTPFAVVVTASGQLMPFSGALPYEQIQGLIAEAFAN